jgi:quinolinate synthetase A
MAETAKILNPTKKVVLPDFSRLFFGRLCVREGIREMKKKYPNAIVVSYINCDSTVKLRVI